MKSKVLIGAGALILIGVALFLYFYLIGKNTTKNQPTVEKSTYEQRIVLLNEAVTAKLVEESATNVSIEGPESNPEGPSYAMGIYRTKSAKTGVFLAHRVNNQWLADWTGEKGYTCEEIQSFKFPESITGCK